MKKVSAIIVCCLLAVALIALPVFAAQTATFTVKASKTTVDPGDIITVKVNTTEVTNCTNIGVSLMFDEAMFEVVANSAKQNSSASMGGGDVKTGKVNFFAQTLPAPFGTPFTAEGDIFEVQLKVKDTAVGSSTLSMQAAQAKDTEAATVTATSTVTIKVNCDHTWGQWTPDGDNHKRECTKGCGETETQPHTFGTWSTTTPAGCDTAGEKTRTCTVCNKPETAPVEATGNHTFTGAWTKVDDNQHKRTCSTCQDGTPAIETKNHTWDNGVEKTPAGCDTAGVKLYTCTDNCGATKEAPIEATGDHVWGAWTKVDGTNHKRTCTTCQDGTPAEQSKAHTWGAWTEVAPADCKNDGEEKRTCTDNCGAFETRPIPATGNHGYQTWTKVDNEKHTAVCSGCGGFPVTQDHTWDNGVVKTPAGCDKDGEMLFTCTANGCGAEKTVTIEATGDHVYGAWTKVDDNQHKRTCTTCKDGTPAEETAAHTWDAGVVKTPAGCDKAGVMLYTCTANCGATKEEPIEATGNHTYGDWVEVDENNHKRTCTTCQDGTPAEETEAHKPSVDLHKDADNHWNECYCGKKMNVTAHVYNTLAGDAEGHAEGCECGAMKPGAAKAPHTWDNGVVTKKPSKTEYGEKTFTCTACEYKRTERIDKVVTPNGGDNTLVIPMVILAVLSACGLAVTVVARKRASR